MKETDTKNNNKKSTANAWIKDKTLPFCFSFIMTTFSMTAIANPLGGQITAGSAEITSSDPNTLLIHQHSDQAIINWESFNIGPTEKTQFIQPSSTSSALNRISPYNGASQIFGQLTANGQIILVNQAGIYFGPDSRVDVSGLIASTTHILDSNYLAKQYIFDQPSDTHVGSIINAGTITAADHGLVALIGNNVRNDGLIQANLGSVVLASGSQFTIDLSGNELINFAVDSDANPGVDQNGNAMENGIENNGHVIADGGKILMTAKSASNVLDNAINMRGVAQAQSVSMKNGEIILSANGTAHVSGKVDASGLRPAHRGGSVKVLAKKVNVTPTAIIDTSGDEGGGNITIGGNAHGTGPDMNADYTVIAPGSQIFSDAITYGDGGNIIIWSNSGTHYFGNIFARGGNLSGNGGYVEISALEGLNFNGEVDTSSATGLTGTLLLDPKFIIISTSGGSAYNNNVNNLFANNANGTSTITPASLNTNASITLQANTDVTFTDAVSMTNNNRTLKVQAGRSIFINNDISTSGNNQTITMTANDNAATGTRDAGVGNILFGAGATLSTASNAISLNIGSSTSGSFSPGSMTQTDSTIAVNSGTAAITLNVPTNSTGSIGTNSQSLLTQTTGTLNITTGSGGAYVSNSGSMTLGTISLNANSPLKIISSGTLTLPATAISTGTGQLTLASNGGSLTTNAAGNFSTTSGAINLTGSSGLTINNTVSSSLAGGTINLNTTTGNVTIATGKSVTTGGGSSLTISTPDLTLTGTGSLNSGAGNTIINATGSIGLGATAGTMTISGTELQNITSNNLTLNAGNNTNIIVNGVSSANSTNNNLVTLRTTGTGSINFNTAASAFKALTAISAGTLTVNQNISTAANGNINLVAPIFINNVGATPLSPGSGGRFLVWTTNPANDTRGVMTYAFKQYNATFGSTTVLGTGNGLLYSVAPSITPSLIGTVTKVYDGTTTATLSAANYTTSGAIDGDTISLNTPTSGTYNNKNVGNSKNVSVTGIALNNPTATNGSVSVYGYQLSSTTANANIGTISARALDINATSNSKVYDGTTASSATPTSGTLYGTDTVTDLTQAFNSKNVLGTNGSTLSVTGYTVNDGNGGNNYSVALHTASGTISARALDIYATSDSKVYDGTTASSATPTVGTLYSTDTVTDRTQAFDSKNVLGVNGSTLSVTSYTINDDNNGNNYNVTLHTANGTISARALDIYATSDSKVYDGTTASSATPTVGTLYGTDTVTDRTQEFDSKNVLGTNGSTLSVTGYTINDGNSGNNYAVTTHTASGTIAKALLTLTALTNTKTYDGTISAAAIPTQSGLQSGDSITELSETYDNTNAGTGKILSVATYTINDGNSGNNYLVSTVNNATGVINPATLTYQATPLTLTYGSDIPTLNGTVTGFVGTDTLATATTGTSTFTTTATNTSNVGNYPITGSGLTANNGNYVFVQAPDNATALTITPTGFAFNVQKNTQIVVQNNAGIFQLYVDNNLVQSTPIINVNAVTINGAGNNALTLNYTGALNIPIVFNGNTSISSDRSSVNLTNGIFNTITHHFNNATTGNINLDGKTVSYTMVSKMTDNLTATHRIFNFNEVGGNIQLGDAVQIAGTVSPSISFSKPNTSLIINGNNNSIAINNAIAGNYILTLNNTGANDIAIHSSVNMNAINITSDGGNIQNNNSLGAVGNIVLSTPNGSITSNGSVRATRLTTLSKTGTTMNKDNLVSELLATNTGSGDVQFTNNTALLTVLGINQLGAGNIVINNTSGDITNSGIIMAAINRNISLTANGFLTINAAITTTGSGKISLVTQRKSNEDININAAISSGTGNILINSDDDINMGVGGSITTSGTITQITH